MRSTKNGIGMCFDRVQLQSLRGEFGEATFQAPNLETVAPLATFATL